MGATMTLKSFGAVLGSALLLVLAAGRPVLAYDYLLGPPNLERYCKETYGRLFTVAQLGPNAQDWVCQSNRRDRPIDVRAACVLFNKGNANMTQAFFDGRQWQCKWVLIERPVNLTIYCAKHFGNGWQALLHGTASTDWSCQKGNDNNNRRPISVADACKEQWPYNYFFKAIPVPKASWQCLLKPT